MKKIFFSLLAFLACGAAGAQIITTVAGTGGASTFNGDTIAAITANLNEPINVLLDGLGNYYIADRNHNRIRKVSASGIITTIAGTGVGGYSGDNGPATAAKIYAPVGMAFDAAGNLYFADDYNNRVRKISLAGIITTVAGTDTAGYNGDHIPATSARLYSPHHIVFDSYGNLYICDMGNHRIRRVNTSGIITTTVGTGSAGYSGDDSAAIQARIHSPYGIAIEPGGSIIFSDYMEHCIRKINASGIITTVAGTGTLGYNDDNIPATSAQLNTPCGVTFDQTGNIYIADGSNSRIRKIDNTGIITTIAGTGVASFGGDSGPATDAELRFCSSVSIDNSGNIYVADFGNNRVRLIKNATFVDEIGFNNFIKIYPNPTCGIFTMNVTIPGKQLVKITITDISGRVVMKQEIEANLATVVTLNEEPGIYSVNIASHKGSFTKLLVIQ